MTVEQLRGTEPLPDPLPIGERLSGLFARRARTLDADAQMVLLLAAAERFGETVLLRRAAEAVGDLSWDEAATKAEASGLVAFTPNVEFRHPLVRSAAYYSGVSGRSAPAHAALAEVLDSAADADRRAWHLGAAAAAPTNWSPASVGDVGRASAATRRRVRRGRVPVAHAAELTPDPERAAERLLEAARAELVGGRAHGRARSSIAPGRQDLRTGIAPRRRGRRR